MIEKNKTPKLEALNYSVKLADMKVEGCEINFYAHTRSKESLQNLGTVI